MERLYELDRAMFEQSTMVTSLKEDKVSGTQILVLNECLHIDSLVLFRSVYKCS